jgi:hypothetical protein
VPAWSQKVILGTIISDVAIVYSAPDFDARPIAQLKKGQKIRVINKRQNIAFFKIQLPNKKTGYVLDIDVHFIGKTPLPKGPLSPQEEDVIDSSTDPFLDAESFQDSTKSEEEMPGINYEWERLLGVRNHFIAFREKTMGRDRRNNLSALGLVWRGPDWVDFAAYTDLGISVTTKPPDYYEKELGYTPSGYAAWGYLLFTTASALSPRAQMVYGFGPFLRVSSWRLLANTHQGVQAFDAVDVKLGGMGSWGVAYRFKPFAIRADFQFWWEVSQYSSLALAIEIPYPK